MWSLRTLDCCLAEHEAEHIEVTSPERGRLHEWYRVVLVANSDLRAAAVTFTPSPMSKSVPETRLGLSR